MSQLALDLRPLRLEDFVGQTHLVGQGKPLTVMAGLGQISSMIFWGPPGVGKTTLARILANSLSREFIELSAVAAGKADIKKIIDTTRQQKNLSESYEAPVVFLDEIHRFNKLQQDYLLPHVENKTIILIGATTENPSFEVISALLSRTKVFVLERLSETDLSQIIDQATGYLQKKLKIKITVVKSARDWLIQYANGDARKIIGLIETTFELYQNLKLESLQKTLTAQALKYDKSADEHYNTISAFIKSMRASNTNAALYYLARMVEGGEDPKFIARRMVIFASEDIGLAVPTALVVANAVFEAVHKVGYPEAGINLAHGVAYLCSCKKDRSAYNAWRSAQADALKYGNLPIPLELRNAPAKLMEDLQYGQGYTMYSGKKSLLPDKIRSHQYLKK
ncbi:MAG: replication-associated recombination protein A [Patescibacteria group bacterium]